VGFGGDIQMAETNICQLLARREDASNNFNIPDITTTKVDFNSGTGVHDLIVNNMSVDTPNLVLRADKIINQTATGDISYNIGTTHFDGGNYNIIQHITLDPTSIPVVNGSLKFQTTAEYGPFYDTDSGGDTWDVTFTQNSPFDPDDPHSSLALAINNGHNNLITGNSLITIEEDTDFNSNYALANLNTQFNQYFTKTTLSNGSNVISTNTLTSANQLGTNNINVAFVDEDMNANASNFGTYKFVKNQASTSVSILENETTPVASGVLPFVDGLDANLPSSLTLQQFSDLFGNTTEGFTFKIEASIDSPGNDLGGYLPDFSNSAPSLVGTTLTLPFSIDNNAILNNFNYINAGYQNLANNITVSQSDMTITADGSSNNNFLSASNLSASGELLTSTPSTTDGHFIIRSVSDASNGRVTFPSGPGSSNYTGFHVLYPGDANPLDAGFVTGGQQTELNVGYEAQNILLPTGHSQYFTDVSGTVSNSNGSSLYLAAIPPTDISFISYIATAPDLSSNWATYFTIDATNSLSNEKSFWVADTSYVFNNPNQVPFDISVNNVKANISVTGLDTSGGLQYQFYREYLISKQIADLNLGLSDPNWILVQGISGDEPFLVSAQKDVNASIPRIFPRIDQIEDLVNNDSSLNIQILYTSEPKLYTSGHTSYSSAYAEDMVFITWNKGPTNVVDSDPIKLTITQYNDNQQKNIIRVDAPADISYQTVTILGDGASNYTAFKITSTQQYTSRFKLPLSGFDNLYIQTPMVKTVLSFYALFDVNLGITNPVANSDQSVTVSVLGGFTDADGNPLTPTERITLASDGVSPVQLSLNINKKSVTCLLGKLQGVDGAVNTWNDVSLFADVDPYFGTKIESSLIAGPRTPPQALLFVAIDPAEVYSQGIGYVPMRLLPYYSYQIRLNANTTSNNYIVNGYTYNSTQIASFDFNNTPTFPFTPDFATGSSVFPEAPTFDVQYLTTYKDISYNAQNNVTINLYKDATKAVKYATIFAGTQTFVSRMTLFHVPKPVFVAHQLYGEIFDSGLIYLQGDDANFSVNPAPPHVGISSGHLIVDSGVVIDYSNIQQVNDTGLFTLNTDKFAVNVNGAAGTPDYITSVPITWQTVNGTTNSPSTYSTAVGSTETLTLPYYRGYNFYIGGSHLTGSSIDQTYTINRNANRPDAYWGGDAHLGHLYYGFNPDVSYNTVGSIGQLPTFNWSRLPANFLFSGALIVPINVVGDTVTITTSNTASGIISTTSKNLKTALLYTFNNETTIHSQRIRVNTTQSILGANNLLWSASYNRNNTDVYYSSTTFSATDPSTYSYSLITSFADSDTNQDTGATGGKFNYGGQNNGGPFQLQTHDNTLDNTTSYFVVAAPQVASTQANYNAVSAIPFNLGSYDPTQLVTVYSDILFDIGNSLSPFSGIPLVNNITFTHLFSKPFSQYITRQDPTLYHFNITGSSINIYEYVNNIITDISPIYSGLIVNLPSSALDVTVDATGVYTIRIYQSLDTAGTPNSTKNITFTIGNLSLPTRSAGSAVLPLLPLSATQFSIIGVMPIILNDTSSVIVDAQQKNYGLQLYKYICPETNYVPFNYVSMPFSPSNRYYSRPIRVPVPAFGETPYNLSDALDAVDITAGNQPDGSIVDGNGHIIWTEDLSFNSNNPFNFDLTALDTRGQQFLSGTNLTNTLMPIASVTDISIFTYITTPDIMNIVSGDGASVYRVDANGRVLANLVGATVYNTYQSQFFNSSPANATPPCNNEFVSYNVETFPVD